LRQLFKAQLKKTYSITKDYFLPITIYKYTKNIASCSRSIGVRARGGGYSITSPESGKTMSVQCYV